MHICRASPTNSDWRPDPLLGHVAYDDLPRWYSACSLFAMPNRDIGGDTEGFGLVFLEAASAGDTGISRDGRGTGSAVVDGVTGLRVDGESLDCGRTRPGAAAHELCRGGADGACRTRARSRFYTHQRRVDQLRSLARRGRYRTGTRPEGGSAGKSSTT